MSLGLSASTSQSQNIIHYPLQPLDRLTRLADAAVGWLRGISEPLVPQKVSGSGLSQTARRQHRSPRSPNFKPRPLSLDTSSRWPRAAGKPMIHP